MQQPPEYTRLWKQASADYKLRDNLEVTGGLVWDGSECEEINLWTYWQGKGNYSPNVVVVGQDWGQINNSLGKKFIKNVKRINREEDSNIFDGIEQKEMFPTDLNLIELFRSMGIGYDDIKNIKYKDLFFTNICLGYRTGKSSGNIDKLWSKHKKNDIEKFKELIKILKPKIILCLGKDTFISVIEALENKEERLPKGYSYNKCIEDNCPRNIKFLEAELKVFALAHPGKMGTLNRNSRKSSISLEKQIEDWQRVAVAITNVRG